MFGKLRVLLKRMARALGEEHGLTLITLNTLGTQLCRNSDYVEAKKVYEKCLAARLKIKW